MKKSSIIIFFISSVFMICAQFIILSQVSSSYCDGTDIRTSKATWYAFPSVVHCSYPANTLPEYFAAINGYDYDTANACGGCIEVSSPGSGKSPIILQIVDECPYEGNEQWCYDGSNHVDMGPAAFEHFADLGVGVIDIEWKYIPCAVAGNLTYAFKDGSSIWWSGIMIRNYPVPITTVEIKTAATNWRNLPRMDYNYWLDESGFGEGPYTLRITDVLGDVVEAHDIPSLTNDQVPAVVEKPLDVQLPGCSGTSATPTPVPIPPGLLGDVNNDDSIDIVDALLAAQFYVELNPAGFDAQNADVNCDGTVDIVDALRIAQYYVELISGFCI